MLDVLLRRVESQEESKDLFRIVHTGIGQIPYLHIGQRWRNKQEAGVAPLQAFRRKLNFRPGKWRLIEAGEALPASRSARTEYLIPPFVHRLTSETLASRCLAFGLDGIPDVVIVPCIEIARAWYLRSTELTLRLTSAPFSEAKKRIFNNNYPPFAKSGNNQVMLRTGLSQSDVLVAAMLACDDIAAECASVMMDSLAEAATRRKPAFLTAHPPVEGTLPVRANGRWFTSGGQERFLVYYFTAVPFPALTPELEWDLDNSNLGKTGITTEVLKTAWPRRPATVRASPGMRLRHAGEPDTNFAVVEEQGSQPSFIDTPELHRLPPREKTSQQVTVTPTAEPPPGNELSTGEGRAGNDGPGKLRIKDTEDSEVERARRDIIPAGFNQILAIVEILNSLPEFRCTVIAASESVGPPHAPRTLFPERHEKITGNWQLINERARQYLAIEVVTRGMFAYLFEIERRPAADGGSKSQEHFSLGVIAAIGGRRLGQEDFEAIAVSCVQKKGVWPTKQKGFVVRRLRHSYTDLKRYAVGIATSINAILGIEKSDDDEGAGEVAAPALHRQAG